ncbi:hypothetical protein Taro_054633 [Colocasia esculenta]|uniref:Uncharacterized protein n=1 Tax=Colocasia esculenta TaxID=4460 RepID=A0A843XR99_COLES|nr:hypothetical protein [Colocasia esculenta]
MPSLHGLCVRGKSGNTTPFVVTSRVGYPRFFVSQARGARVCIVKVCVVFLDTLTLEFELYVQLRERR